jgi:MOSC domain-containing protein YiiM
LIEREQIAGHAAALGLASIPPGAVRANIETTGLDLMAFLGKRIQIGESLLSIYEARRPCEKMDAVCFGLRRLMENQRQGVLAEVVRSGKIKVGDPISVVADGDRRS